VDGPFCPGRRGLAGDAALSGLAPGRYHARVTAQDPGVGEGPGACPFVALVDDRDGRSVEPDPRHRCFAEVEPAPRALAHQAHYCLAPAFSACPTFQDWARREAARVVGGIGAAEPAVLPSPPEAGTPVPPSTAPLLPVEPTEEVARPASRVWGLWGAVAAAGATAAAEPAEPPTPAEPAIPAELTATAELAVTPESIVTAEPVTSIQPAPPDDVTVAVSMEEVLPGAVSSAGDLGPPAPPPPFLAGRPEPAAGPPAPGQGVPPVQEVPPGQPPRRLRPDDEGWASQVDMRRNLPPESSAYAGQPADRLRPDTSVMDTGARVASPPPARGPDVEPVGVAAVEAGLDPAPAGDAEPPEAEAPGSGPAEAPLPIYARLAAASVEPAPLDPEETALELAAYLRRRAGGGETRPSRPTVHPATPGAGVAPAGTGPARTPTSATRTVAAGGVLAAGGALTAGGAWGEPAPSPERPGAYNARPGTGVGPVYDARPGTGVVPGGTASAYPAEPSAYPKAAPPGSWSGGAPVPVTGSQARPAVAGAKPRVARDKDAPPWEPPRRHEAYPTIRGRVGLPRIPRALILAAALLIAALLIFLAPSFFAGGGGTASPTPSASRTAGASASAGTSGSPAATPRPTATGVEPTVYTVAPNDTLSGIAAKFGVTTAALLEANPQIKDPNQIAVGDKITIPPKTAPASPTPAKTPKPTAEPT